MNYSLALKEELIAGAPHAACCRRAYLRGLFFDAGETRSGGIALRISTLCAREEAARMYHALYRREPLAGGTVLLFSCDALYRDLTAGPPLFRCERCAAHFLRGLTVAYGSVTDPKTAYHLEYTLHDPAELPFLTDFFAERAWPMKSRRHRDGIGLYCKNSTTIEEILTYMGANNALFALMNAKIARGIRNEENRATNCVTTNIGKAVDAAGKTLEAIAAIRAAGAFERMPQKWQETARLREENPGSTLTELAQLHDPPMTKSGLNHRLQNIAAYAEELRITGKKI